MFPKGTYLSYIFHRFTDPNIYYQKYQEFDKVNLYRESLFQILPRSNFDMHDQMMQTNLRYIFYLFLVRRIRSSWRVELLMRSSDYKIIWRLKLVNRLCMVLKLSSGMWNHSTIYEGYSKLRIKGREPSGSMCARNYHPRLFSR